MTEATEQGPSPEEYLQSYGIADMNSLHLTTGVPEGILRDMFYQAPGLFATITLGAVAFKDGAVMRMPYAVLPKGDPPCPADAPNAAPPSPSTLPPSSETPLNYLPALVSALQRQVEAISRLANSNALLAEAVMAQYDESEEGQPSQYMDGKPAPRPGS